MMFGIGCLMVSKLSVTDALRDTLYRMAFNMYTKGDEVQRVRGEDCEGKLKIKFPRGMLGNFRGPVFSAQLETEHGSGMVEFIIDGRELPELESGEWLSLPLPPGWKLAPFEEDISVVN